MKTFKKIFPLSILFASALILFSSINSMSQWIQQQIPVNRLIQDLSFTDENFGWATTVNTEPTDTGYILFSSNGGTAWFIQHQGNYVLYHINAISNQVAFAGGTQAGGSSLLLKTTNAGLNWVDMNIAVLTGIDAMYFVDENTGYIGDGLFNGLYRTTDGGFTWQQRQNGLMVLPKCLFFLNADTGFCGGGGRIFKTTNAGMNWQFLIDLGVGGRQVTDIQFLSETTGWVSLTSNGIGVTTNGGFNWQISKPSPIGTPTIQSVYFTDTAIGWSGRMSPIIYKSIDGGYNWVSQLDSAGSKTIHMNDSLLGWSGYLGIAKTTTGGLTFISEVGSEIPTSFKLYQNYPNPFNPVTAIRFEVSKHIEVKLKVYNTLGQSVAIFIDQKLEPGIYEYTWNASGFSTGVYFYVLETEGFRDTKKLVLLK